MAPKVHLNVHLELEVTMRLTDAKVKKLEIRTAKYAVAEEESKGFIVLVYPSGLKAFYYRHTSGGIRKLSKLGAFPNISTDAARELWLQHKNSVPLSPEGVPQILLSSDIEGFRQHIIKRQLAPLTLLEYTNQCAVLQRTLGPDALTTDMTDDVVEGIFDELTLYSNDRGNRFCKGIVLFHKYLRKHYKKTSVIVQPNPCEDILRNPKGIDLHHLRQDHLATLLPTVPHHAMAKHMKLAMLFQLVTGCRVYEALRIHKDQFSTEGDALIWHLAPEENKMGRAHLVPLPYRTSKILRGVIETHPKPYLCEHRQLPNHTNYGSALKYLCDAAGVPRIAGKHLRTTVNTLLTKLGCVERDRVAILNHAPKGVNESVYNAYEYYTEKLQWCQKLEDLYASYGLFKPA